MRRLPVPLSTRRRLPKNRADVCVLLEPDGLSRVVGRLRGGDDYSDSSPPGLLVMTTSSSRSQDVREVDSLCRQNVETIARIQREAEGDRTLSEMVADAFAKAVGSWTFIILQSCLLSTRSRKSTPNIKSCDSSTPLTKRPVYILPPDRKAVLDQKRRLKMARSAHAYVRGNTLRFYEWLETGDAPQSIPEGPPIWICGDCHIGNLGPVADLDGKIEIQIRDLDQTVIGNPSHDVLRLGLSLAMAARSSDLPGLTTALMIEIMIDAYIHGLLGHKAKDDGNKISAVQEVMQSASSRKWRHLAAEHIRDARPEIPLGDKLWPLTAEERNELLALFENPEEHHLIESISGGKKDVAIRVLDAAYWVKGCSSLGRVRFAVLVGVGKKRARKLRLIDVKEATKALAPATKGAKMPKNDAERVVQGARALSPFLGQRMVPAAFAGRHVVVRELRPQDLKFEFSGLTQQEAILTARLLAGVVGKAHGRQMKSGERKSWARTLKASYSKTLDAPSWLWNGVVDLVAIHEAAYLRHCRQFALSEAKGID